MSTERADFEAWYEKQMGESPRMSSDTYTPFATACWEAWQAGRADLQSREQEDAKRYRWIAAHCRSTSEHWGGRWSIIVDGPAPKSHNSEDDFNDAIDAAMMRNT